MIDLLNRFLEAIWPHSRETAVVVAANSKEPTADRKQEQERTKQTLSVQFEEYKSLRAEYAQHLSYQHLILTLTFALAAAILAASPTVVASKEPGAAWLYALASIIFLAVSWAQLRYLEANVAIRNYIIVRLTPRIEKNLRKLDGVTDGKEPPAKDEDKVFGWESEGIAFTYRSEWWLFPIMAARVFLSLVSAFVSAISFVLFAISRSWVDTYVIAMVVFLSLGIVFTTFAIFKVRDDVNSQPDSNWPAKKTRR